MMPSQVSSKMKFAPQNLLVQFAMVILQLFTQLLHFLPFRARDFLVFLKISGMKAQQPMDVSQVDDRKGINQKMLLTCP